MSGTAKSIPGMSHGSIEMGYTPDYTYGDHYWVTSACASTPNPPYKRPEDEIREAELMNELVGRG